MNKSTLVLIGTAALLTACASPPRPENLQIVRSNYTHPVSKARISNLKLTLVGDKCYITSNVYNVTFRANHVMSGQWDAVKDGDDIRCANGTFTNHTLGYSAKNPKDAYFIRGKAYHSLY